MKFDELEKLAKGAAKMGIIDDPILYGRQGIAEYYSAANPETILKMIAVCRAGMALKGDLTAGNEEPTHYTSWFRLNDSLKELEKK